MSKKKNTTGGKGYKNSNKASKGKERGVNPEYQEAYLIHLKRLKSVNKKFGETKCIVCDKIFKKINAINYYCSKDCSKISHIKREIDLRKKNTTSQLSKQGQINRSFSKLISVQIANSIYEKIIKSEN